MQFDVRQLLAGALTIGMFVTLLDMIIGGPITVPSRTQEVTLQILSTQGELVELSRETIDTASTVSANTPKKLWGLPGPVLQPCWSRHLVDKHRKTKGYVLVELSNGPLFHPVQVADAVIIARYLGAALVLPKIKEATKERNDGFSKVYDVKNFVSSLKDVVRVVARLPAALGSFKPTFVKVPYKVTPEYIDDTVQPVFDEKSVIQIRSIFSASNSRVKDSSTAEMQAIRCLVMYGALQFHPHIKELGEQIMSSLREASHSNRFIAVDLRVTALNQAGCRQPKQSKSKKCFDASDITNFLENLGFPSSVPIYLTQSRWDERLAPLKDSFPKVHIKEHHLTLLDNQLIEGSQLEKAIDVFVCTQSDVFVPAISGISYVNIAGLRISAGKTQILVPTVMGDSPSRLQIPRVLSHFVTKKDHTVYTCFCKPSSIASKTLQENFVR